MEKRRRVLLGICLLALEALGGEGAPRDPVLESIYESEEDFVAMQEKRSAGEDPTLDRYGIDEERVRKMTAAMVPTHPESQKPKAATGDLPAPPDPRLTLGLKEIVEPLPQDYAPRYLKLKTLFDPTKKYVRVHIDKSRQRMWVYLDNDYVGDWKVSTARRGYWTPVGTYRPYSLERMHYSRKYHNSPMPWSVFFKGGYAIHGTYSIRHLGRPASHGCVRVHPRNAKKLYQLIRRYGKRQTRIYIRG